MDDLLGLQDDFNRLFEEGPRRYTGGRRHYPLVKQGVLRVSVGKREEGKARKSAVRAG